MADRDLKLDFFCEDGGHELFVRAISKRLAEEEGAALPALRVVASRGGYARARAELRTWLRMSLRPPGDLLVVLLDANSEGWLARRQEVERELEAAPYPAVVVGCADPHVEAWLLADRTAVEAVLGPAPRPEPSDPKGMLHAWVSASQVPILGAPMSLAQDIVPVMDLFLAGQAAPSLRHFVNELRGAVRRLADSP